jgi:hypothetical protein
MILSATVRGEYRLGAAPGQVDALVTEIMATLDGGDPWQDMAWARRRRRSSPMSR